jgi:hypothetical protein
MIDVVEAVEKLVDEERRRATLRNEDFRRVPALKRALNHLNPRVELTTYYKYRKIYRSNNGSRAEMAASLQRFKARKPRLTRTQLHLTDTLLIRFGLRSDLSLRPGTIFQTGESVLNHTRGLWVDPIKCPNGVPENLVEELLNPQIPITAILENPEKEHLLTEIRMPSKSWFYEHVRLFKSLPDLGKKYLDQQYGKGTWDSLYLVFDTFAALAILPLQYVFADHYQIKVRIVDEATRSIEFDLWLTCLIDACTRSILGIALLDAPPSTMSIQTALRHAIWPKSSHLNLEGIAGDWPCYGIPSELSLDNAKAHLSFSLEDLCKQIGRLPRGKSIDIVLRPPYKARYGALIERFFGVLTVRMQEFLEGRHKTRRSPYPKRQAKFLWEDINWFIHDLIIEHQNTSRDELGGMTPNQKWQELTEANGLVIVPALTDEVERLFWRLEPNPRKLTSRGICAFDMEYRSPDIGGIPRVGSDGKKVEYKFRYHPDDISVLALFRDGSWQGDVIAKQMRDAYGHKSLSLIEWKLAHILSKQATGSVRNWLQYVTEAEERTRARRNEKNRAQRALNKKEDTKSAGSSQSKPETEVRNDIPMNGDYQSDPTGHLVNFLKDRKSKT